MRLLIARRRLRDVEPEKQRRSLSEFLERARKSWHGVKLWQPDWSDSSQSLAFSAELPKENLVFHLILNAYWEPLEFELPPLNEGAGERWRRWIDTALSSPYDIVEWQTAPAIASRSHRAGPRSVAVLFANRSDERVHTSDSFTPQRSRL